MTSAPIELTLPAPQPLYFGAEQAPMLGWYHGTAVPARCAVLICAPWGDEELGAYRGLFDLATQLAEAGVPVLRFDLVGEGDSFELEGAGQADRWPHWLGAVQAAMSTLQACSGAPRLAVLGVRLGALLAAHAAAGRNDVAALVGVLPPASGRAWVRETRMAGASLGAEDRGDGSLQAGGFELNPATAAHMASLAWPVPGPGSVPPRALLMDRADLPLPAAALAAWQAMAGGLDHQRRDDLGDVVAVAHAAQWPGTLRASLVAWLQGVVEADGKADADARAEFQAECQTESESECLIDPQVESRGEARAHPQGAAPVTATPCTGLGARVVAQGLQESVVQIGGMVGVLSRPLATPGGGVPALLLLSSGAERRTGPHRLWVPLARQRARAGEVVLRLDLAGLGDSPLRAGETGTHIYDARCARELFTAVEWLRREQGVGTITVVGICSGAYHAWHAAQAGLGVDAVVSVNPLVFHWQPGMSLDPADHAFGQIGISSDAARSARDLRSWLKLLRGRVRVRVILAALLGRLAGALRARLAQVASALGVHFRDDLARELQQVVRRGVAVHFVFAAGEPGRVLLERGAGPRLERLTREGRVRLTTIEQADHTFMHPNGRHNFYHRLHPLLDTAARRSAPVAQAAHPSALISS